MCCPYVGCLVFLSFSFSSGSLFLRQKQLDQMCFCFSSCLLARNPPRKSLIWGDVLILFSFFVALIVAIVVIVVVVASAFVFLGLIFQFLILVVFLLFIFCCFFWLLAYLVLLTCLGFCFLVLILLVVMAFSLHKVLPCFFYCYYFFSLICHVAVV